MKRVLAVLILLVAIFILCVYLFIPSSLKVSSFVVIPANSDAAFRVVSNPLYWHQHCDQHSETASTKDSTFYYNDQTFSLVAMMHNAARINIQEGPLQTNSFFTILPVSKDSSVVKWETEIPSTNNPIEKIKRYRQAVSIKKSMSGMLGKMQNFLEKPENVYGYAFHVASTNDTLLVALKKASANYPGTEDLYAYIGQLQQYVQKKGARQVAPPMVNISQEENGWQTMIALPVNKALEVSEPYLYRKLVKGNFLIARVKGGDSTVNHALEMMRLYINDYGKTAMAIPFQKLLTNRQAELDSSKWITDIYYPVIR